MAKRKKPLPEVAERRIKGDAARSSILGDSKSMSCVPFLFLRNFLFPFALELSLLQTVAVTFPRRKFPQARESKRTQLIVFAIRCGLESFIVIPRRPRNCPAGTCFHVINRAVARLTLFEKQDDYEAFERVLKLEASWLKSSTGGGKVKWRLWQ